MLDLEDGRRDTGYGGVRTFKDLQVWKSSHELVLNIYKVSSTFPKDELYGLTSQMRRAVVSVAANITEGFSRRTDKDKIHFYNMSQSSLHEIKYYLILIQDLGYIESNTALQDSAESIGKMLYRLIESTKSKSI